MRAFDVDVIPGRLLSAFVLTGALSPFPAIAQDPPPHGDPPREPAGSDSTPRDEAAPDRDRVDRLVVDAFTADRPEEALRLLDAAIRRWPDDSGLHYGRSCALALLERRDDSGAALIEAVRNGFRDFDAMRLDPALRSMRNHPVFQAILEADGRTGAPDPTPPSDEDSLRRRFGDDYHIDSIDDLRIHLACGLPRRSCVQMISMLTRQSEYQLAALFDAAAPDWCTIIVPAARDETSVFRGDLGLEDPNRTPGAYRHDRRLLVSRDIGSSMRHEYTHRLHWADMDARRQRHPMWIQEGLASLFEDYEWRDAGVPRFVPNLRHAIVHRQVSTGRDVAFSDLLGKDFDAFRDDRSALYPQVRSVFEFIAERGRLETWYRAYVENHALDPSGRVAIEQTFGRPIQQVNEQWRRWVLDRGSRDATLELGDPYPGILVEDAGDGVRILRLVTQEARRAGLRVGDVVMKVDDDPVRTRGAWFIALAKHRLGDVVRLECRRAGVVRASRIRLHPFGSR